MIQLLNIGALYARWFQVTIITGFLILLAGCGSTLWPSDDDVSDNMDQSPPSAPQNFPLLYPAPDQERANQSSQNTNISPAPQTAQRLNNKPILTVYFTEENTAYQRSLLKVVERVLPLKPDARFTIFGISPADTSAEYERMMRYNDRIRQSLTDMGIQNTRISDYVAAGQGGYPQIMVYVE